MSDQLGEDHVLPSIRPAQIRDCVEDYEWLKLAAAVDSISRTLIRSLTDFTRDPSALREAHGRLARMIGKKGQVRRAKLG